MDLAQTIEFEENFRPKLESKEGILLIKEEKIDPTKHLSSVGKEIVRMDFDETIVFEENIMPKLESKEGLLCIKEETIDFAKEKLKFLASAEKDLSVVGKEIVQMDFAQTIEFEENIKPKVESKEGLLCIKKEKIDPRKDFSCIGKEMVEMDFLQTIEFEENIKPKLESKEGILHLKEEKSDSTEEKLKFLASGEKNLSNVGKEIVEMDFAQTIQFEEDMKPKLESKEFSMKTEVKTEVKEESFETFEAREQGGIDFITSKNFDQDVNETEFPTQKTDCRIKRKIREEPNESNVPLKMFKQKGSVHQSMSMGEEFDTNLPSELNEKSNSDDENGDDLDFSLDEEDNIPDFDETVRNLPTVGEQLNSKRT